MALAELQQWKVLFGPWLTQHDDLPHYSFNNVDKFSLSQGSGSHQAGEPDGPVDQPVGDAGQPIHAGPSGAQEEDRRGQDPT